MASLAEKKCVPCRGGVPPLPRKRQEELLRQLDGWALNPKGHLEKSYSFPDYWKAFEFVERVSRMAEEQGHHPDVFLSWGKATLEVWTHKINGLVESDFIFAAKADALLEPARK